MNRKKVKTYLQVAVCTIAITLASIVVLTNATIPSTGPYYLDYPFGYGYYIGLLDNATYYSVKGSNWEATVSSNASFLFEDAIDNLDSLGGSIFVQNGLYEMDSPIVIPSGKLVEIIGESNPLSERAVGPILRATGSMSLGYMIYANASAGSGSSMRLVLENLNIEPWNKASMGGVLHESDYAVERSLQIRNVRIHAPTTYGLHIRGLSWRGSIDHLLIDGYGASDSCLDALRIENGSHSSVPKALSFYDLQIHYSGYINHSIYLLGAYCNFLNTNIDGGHYNSSVIELRAGYNNFVNLRTQDLLDAGTARSTFVFTSSDSFDNELNNVHAAGVGDGLVRFENNAEKNYLRIAPMTASQTVNATGAGTHNEVHFLTSKLFSSLTIDGNLDFSGYGVEANGTATFNNNNSATFSHGMVTRPTFVYATFNCTGWGSWTWTSTAAQITLQTENNVNATAYWRAEA